MEGVKLMIFSTRNTVLYTFIILLALFNSGFSQSVHHWETIVYATDTWKYFVGTSEPQTDWYTLSFVDTSWTEGPGGIGYGDGDDITQIESTISLYMRIKFFVLDTSVISKAVFNMDYDDAFVAYLNGVEIARSNIGSPGDHPAYNETSEQLHEATMYAGGSPEYFYLTMQQTADLFIPGENVLAVQVHNESITSSDLSSIPFLSLGISDISFTYREVSDWFNAPVDFTSSNLPIIIINTDGQEIVDEPKILARMGIISNHEGSRNNITDQFNDYNGKVGIELRGQSSLGYDKKSYGIETRDSTGNDLEVSLLGLPKEEDWVLYGPYSDKTLLRNTLPFYLARELGQYASGTVYCELVLNDDYKGLYILMEKIKRDSGRVDIARLRPEDIDGDELTGGYIIKCDKPYNTGWQVNVDPPGNFGKVYYQYHYPKAEDIVPEQEAYIQNFMYEFEECLVSDNYADPVEGYAKYINVDNFIDHFLIQEFSKEIDSYRFSFFMYKMKDSNGGKLHAGPIWDFNLAYGNFGEGVWEEPWTTKDWNAEIPAWSRVFWFNRLLEDENFQKKLKTRWTQIRQDVFSNENIMAYLDQTILKIEEARIRNFNRWPVIGEYIWPNYYIGNSYDEEIIWLKNWINARLDWMDANMPGEITSIDSGCEDADNHENIPTYAFPNPFNSSSKIVYKINRPGQVTITIFDALGRNIKTNSYYTSVKGTFSFIWDGKANTGENVASSVYFYMVTSDNLVILRGKFIKID
jgi:hypothetical protein